MKVLLSLLGAVAITSSSTALTTSNVFVGHKQEQARLNQNDSGIDWKTLEDETISYFDNFKQQQLFSNNNPQSFEMEQAINYAKEKSLSYVKLFSEQNLSLEEIINQISNEYSEFKTSYNGLLDESLENQKTFFDLNLSNFSFKENKLLSSFNSNGDLTKFVKELKIWKASVTTIAVAAGLASAGFYAAVPWTFGATLPWAIACNVACVAATSISIAFGAAIDIYEKGYVEDAPEEVKKLVAQQIIDFLLNSGSISSAILNGILWAFSAALTIMSIVDLVNEWIEALK